MNNTTYFLSFLATFITSIFAYIKIINDKEQKTTEFRQKWTDSVRTEASKAIKCQKVLWSHHHNEAKWIVAQQVEMKKDNTEKVKIFSDKINQVQLTINKVIEEYEQSMSYLRIALNPEEPENKNFIAIMDDICLQERSNRKRLVKISSKLTSDSQEKVVAELAEVKSDFDEILRNKIDQANDTIRVILKEEWERIKSGEDSYRIVKKIFNYTIAFEFIVLFVIVCFYIFSLFSSIENEVKATQSSPLKETYNSVPADFPTCHYEQADPINININNQNNSQSLPQKRKEPTRPSSKKCP